MTTTDPTKAKHGNRLALLTAEDVERIELEALLDARENMPAVVMLGPCVNAPYASGPQRRLPRRARGLVKDLSSLKLVE